MNTLQSMSQDQNENQQQIIIINNHNIGKLNHFLILIKYLK